MNHFAQHITADRPGLYTPAQREEWERATVKRQIAAIDAEIALAVAKRDRITESINARKKSVERLKAQLAPASPVQSSIAVRVACCR